MPRKYPLQNDLTGQQFGRLTVIEPVEYVIHWECRCECGVVTYARSRALLDGTRVSCGCATIDRLRATMTTHGMGRTKSYKQHTNMLQRCYNPNLATYPRYGGRGIKVCQGWSNFENWYEDFGQHRPSAKHSIDRVDNDGGYWCGKCDECLANDWPMNCEWELQFRQSQNRSTTKFLTFKDRTLSIGEWSQITGVKTNTIHGRIDDGWPIEDILTLPAMAKGEFRKPFEFPDALQNKDLTNQRFGSLVALRSEKPNRHVVWHCICDCGIKTITRALRLIRNETTHCRKRSNHPTAPLTTSIQRTNGIATSVLIT